MHILDSRPLHSTVLAVDTTEELGRLVGDCPSITSLNIWAQAAPAYPGFACPCLADATIADWVRTTIIPPNPAGPNLWSYADPPDELGDFPSANPTYARTEYKSPLADNVALISEHAFNPAWILQLAVVGVPKPELVTGSLCFTRPRVPCTLGTLARSTLQSWPWTPRTHWKIWYGIVLLSHPSRYGLRQLQPYLVLHAQVWVAKRLMIGCTQPTYPHILYAHFASDGPFLSPHPGYYRTVGSFFEWNTHSNLCCVRASPA
jgi:hypothetical protein